MLVASPNDLFRRGYVQDGVIRGIIHHGYDRHPSDRVGMSREQYGELARQDLVTADRATEFTGMSHRVLIGNTASGRVIWANVADPSRSTYFTPAAGVERYMANKERAAHDRGELVRRLDVNQMTVGPEADRPQQLDRTVCATRWAGTPPREREYLRAVAELGGPGRRVTGRAVAERLGLSPYVAAQYRSRLVTSGTLVANGDALDFAVPGMANYVRRQPAPASRSRPPQASPRRAGPAPQPGPAL